MALFATARNLLEEIRQENGCLGVADLAVNGRDMIALGFAGKEIGRRLNCLLELVMDETLENDRDVLLKAAAALPDE